MLDNCVLVKEIKLGIYLTWGGGIVLKLFTDKKSKLLSLQNEHVFILQETVKKSIKDKGFINKYDSENKSKWTKNYLSEIDYKSINDSNNVLSWKWHVYNNCIKVEFNLQDAKCVKYQFNLEELFYLKSLLDEVINNKELVDLRGFRAKSTSEMSKEINDLKGSKLYWLFENIENSINLYEKNYEVLLEYLEKYTGKVEIKDYSWVRRHEQTIFLNEALRHLHNYVAACKSLVDHTRVFNRKYFECPIFHKLCQEKITELFVNNLLSNFISQLREYVQHFSLPGISLHFEFKNNGTYAEVLLIKKDLLLFSGWKSKAKMFLTEQADNINLIQVIKGYHKNTVDLYDWIREQKNILYWSDFREAELKRNAYLAKDGEKIIEKVNKEINNCSEFSPKSILELFDQLLTPKELYDLMVYEKDWPKWLKQAVKLSSLRYPIDNDLQNKLLSLKVIC